MLQLFNMGPQQRPAQHIASAASASPMGMTVEVKEDKKSLTFLASLPGFSRDDIKVMLVRTCSSVYNTKHCQHQILQQLTHKSLHCEDGNATQQIQPDSYRVWNQCISGLLVLMCCVCILLR